MKISIGKNETLGSIQKKFQYAYPYLKLEFFKSKSDGQPLREQLPDTLTVQYTDDQHGHKLINIESDRTVEKLENDLFKKLGLNVQVMRKSGGL